MVTPKPVEDVGTRAGTDVGTLIHHQYWKGMERLPIQILDVRRFMVVHLQIVSLRLSDFFSTSSTSSKSEQRLNPKTKIKVQDIAGWAANSRRKLSSPKMRATPQIQTPVRLQAARIAASRGWKNKSQGWVASYCFLLYFSFIHAKQLLPQHLWSPVPRDDWYAEVTCSVQGPSTGFSVCNALAECSFPFLLFSDISNIIQSTGSSSSCCNQSWIAQRYSYLRVNPVE